MASLPKDKIQLVPIGKIEEEVLLYLKEELVKIFSLPTEVGQPMGMPKSSFNKRRNQYYSPLILRELEKRRSGEYIILGICDLDLYVEGLNFIFGQADILNQVGIISLIRLKPEFYGKGRDEKLFYKRVLTEAVHELGHIFGLAHCPNPKCVMFFSNSILDTDRKGFNFCPLCYKKNYQVEGWKGLTNGHKNYRRRIIFLISSSLSVFNRKK